MAVITRKRFPPYIFVADPLLIIRNSPFGPIVCTLLVVVVVLSRDKNLYLIFLILHRLLLRRDRLRLIPRLASPQRPSFSHPLSHHTTPQPIPCISLSVLPRLICRSFGRQPRQSQKAAKRNQLPSLVDRCAEQCESHPLFVGGSVHYQIIIILNNRYLVIRID